MNKGTMGVNSLPETVILQQRGCDLNPGPSAPESKTLNTRLPSHPAVVQMYCPRPTQQRQSRLVTHISCSERHYTTRTARFVLSHFAHRLADGNKLVLAVCGGFVK